jgi:serine/threonine protein phosphatase 1
MVEDNRFSGDVRDRHLRIDVDQWRDIVVVGDVHGCADALDALFETLDADEETLFVFVGDLVRKGPDSHGVVRRVSDRANAVSVRGNNEDKIIRGDKSLPGLTGADRAYIESLPVAISWAGNLVVHGGVDPRAPLADHDTDDLLEMRSLTPSNSYDRPYWFEEYEGSPRVFFGHTVLADPFVTDAAVGLDTGCVYGGSLTAYVVGEQRLVSVEPDETHVPRSADSIVEPRAREHA